MKRKIAYFCFATCLLTAGIFAALGNPVSAKAEEKNLAFEKRVLSERDMIMAHQGKVTRILVNGKTIVTDLAKDYAKKYHIVIEKVDC